MSKNRITYRPMKRDETDLALFKECFEKNGTERYTAEIQWQYFNNPVGKLYVDYAVSQTDDDNGSQLAGIYASSPVVFKCGTHRVTAVQSMDTLIDEDFRGMGLFTSMAQSVFDRCADDKIGFIYGFPNDNSAHGFFNRLGWTSLDPLPMMIKPLQIDYFLQRLNAPEFLRKLVPKKALLLSKKPELASNVEIRVLLKFDEQYDNLWSRFSADIPVTINRTSAYMNWRFSKPKTTYKTLGLYVDGVLQAMVTYCLENKHGGKIGYIMELIHAPEYSDQASDLLRNVLNELAASKCDAVLAWNFAHSPNHQAYRQNGFFTIPERIRPIHLHIGVRRFAAPDEIALGNRRNWYISYCDSDTV